MAVLSLPAGTTTLVAPCVGKNFVRLMVAKGVLRLAGSYGKPLDDITLAFAGPGQPGLVRLDPERSYMLEAIADSALELDYSTDSACASELITSWLLSFNLMRHYLSADQRINKLISLFGEQFGSESERGILIPFTLPHTRFAEIIGCTRSTATRQLVSLREKGILMIDEKNNSMMFATGSQT